MCLIQRINIQWFDNDNYINFIKSLFIVALDYMVLTKEEKTFINKFKSLNLYMFNKMSINDKLILELLIKKILFYIIINEKQLRQKKYLNVFISTIKHILDSWMNK